MLDLKDRLVQFSREELSMADLKRECLRCAVEDADQVFIILNAALDAGLVSQGEYEALQHVLAEPSQDAWDEAEGDEATVLYGLGLVRAQVVAMTTVRSLCSQWLGEPRVLPAKQ